MDRWAIKSICPEGLFTYPLNNLMSNPDIASCKLLILCKGIPITFVLFNDLFDNAFKSVSVRLAEVSNWLLRRVETATHHTVEMYMYMYMIALIVCIENFEKSKIICINRPPRGLASGTSSSQVIPGVLRHVCSWHLGLEAFMKYKNLPAVSSLQPGNGITST